MKIDVSAELRFPGRVGTYSGDVHMDDIEYLGNMIRFAQPLHIEAQYVYDGGGISFKGSLSTKFLSECALCTAEFIAPFSADFDERFEKTATDDDDDECYPFSGEEIDISQMLTDCILLNHEPYSLCKPDCKGLCPVCGCDLNKVQCDCVVKAEKNEQQNPLSQLGALLNYDKEV